MKPRIAFFDAKPYDRVFFDRVNKEFGYEITYFPTRLNPDTAGLAQGFNTVCAFVNDHIEGEVIDTLDQNGIKLVALRSAGYNNVDLEKIFERIHVVRVPAYSPHAVAEHAVAMIMTLNRKTHKAYSRTRENNFQINGLLGFDMYGKTAGVIGAGKIGREVIRILRGFGMRVLAFDLYPDDNFAAQYEVEFTDLETLYETADIITLHCPLTPENVHMINADSMTRMKDDVMIINTGRGALIDTPALIEALKKRHVGAAGLDVYEEEEQYFFEDFSNEIISDDILARLLTFPNVLVTSHQAFFTREALTNIAGTTLQNIKDFYQDHTLTNEICYKCGKSVCRRKEEGKCW